MKEEEPEYEEAEKDKYEDLDLDELDELEEVRRPWYMSPRTICE